MKLVTIRSWLHSGNAAIAFALLITGLLMMFPDFRSKMIGGFGRELGLVHRWVGWAFFAFPLLFLPAAKILWNDMKKRLSTKTPVRWRKINLGFAIVFAVGINLSGVVLWFNDQVPLFILDASLFLHQVLTFAFIISLSVHLYVARRGIFARFRAWFKPRVRETV